MQINAPQHVKDWLLSRTLDERVLSRAGVHWNPSSAQIVIPIRDSSGTTIFEKFRRDPAIDVGPKYKYTQGAGAALFGLETLDEHPEHAVLICEGEMDALVARSHGFTAVSSTGGAGTFLPEWKEYFKNRGVFILYDNDRAGIRGALNVQEVIPSAGIIELPDVPNVKDLTDWCMHLRRSGENITSAISTLMLTTATTYHMYEIDTDDMDPKEKKSAIATYEGRIAEAQKLWKARKAKWKPTALLDVYMEIHRNRIQEVKASMKRKAKREINTTLIDGAKAVPMDEFLKFTRDGFANCPFHNEDTASFHWIKKSNKGHCFGCNKTADVIEVVAQQEGLKYIEAAKKIMHQ